MKKSSLVIASLVLFVGMTVAQQITKQQASNTDNKTAKKGEKKSMTNKHIKADNKNSDNKSTAPAAK